MKITNKQLRQIIKEELDAVMGEASRKMSMDAYKNIPAPTTTRMAQAPRVSMDAIRVTIENVPEFQDKIEIETSKFNNNILRAIMVKKNKPLGEELAKVFAFGVRDLKPHIDLLSKAQVYVDPAMIVDDDEAMDDKFKDSKKVNRGDEMSRMIRRNMPR